MARFVFLFILAAFFARASEQLTLSVGGLTRTYVLHLPAGLDTQTPAPLVLVLHGGGGHGSQMEIFTHFSTLADREHFIVAYPDGVDHGWNDGRDDPFSGSLQKNVDDLAFLDALMAEIGKRHPLDAKRIYVTGISNGGFMSYTLAARRAGIFAAVAPVCSGIADSVAADFAPAAPVSLLVLQGTADPLVPYAGGEVRGVRGGRGHFIPTDDAIKLWLKANACAPDPICAELPDRDPSDGCRVETFTWANPKNNITVCLYRIDGGGHTWPGGAQYLPQRMIGRVCRDFDATETIWAFFKAHPKM
jgi:polyhydroxybutyrate depolymerase